MAEIINTVTIERTRAIMKEKFPTMVEYFLEDSQKYIQDIDNGLKASDISSAGKAAHTLKSSAYQMGAEQLSEIAKAIESKAQDHVERNERNIDDLAPLLDELNAAFIEVKPSFEAMLKS